MQFFRTLTAAGFIAAAATAPVAAAEMSGAGSSFAYPIYAKWIEAYKKETGVAVDYRSVGSADGIRQVQSKQITFGASDMPLGERDLEADGLVQFPTVVAGVVAVVNVEGIKSGDLTLDGPTLARIFLGEIRSWNDAAIRKLLSAMDEYVVEGIKTSLPLQRLLLADPAFRERFQRESRLARTSAAPVPPKWPGRASNRRIRLARRRRSRSARNLRSPRSM